jgi:hypothetical protein
MDYSLAYTDRPLRYARPASKRAVNSNDGCPPDINDQLLPGSTRTTLSGRQKGLAVENFGIPWSFHHGHFQGTNTCAMDTILMTLFVHMKTAG